LRDYACPARSSSPLVAEFAAKATLDCKVVRRRHGSARLTLRSRLARPVAWIAIDLRRDVCQAKDAFHGDSMIQRELIGTATIPGGEAELRLFRRGADFMIVLDRNELMSSRMSGSEEALAVMTVERLRGRAAPQMLIGGYGMGFTLRAALGATGKDARLTVVELVPEIIDWARVPMAAMAAGCLDDPRTALRIGDVGDAIRSAEGDYDAILLDVDNGPDGLTRRANNGLYSRSGLAAAKSALTPGGILAIWSAAPDKAFAQSLSNAGFIVDEVAVRARSNGKGAKHVIWFATKREQAR
jgi:spermidine synthase